MSVTIKLRASSRPTLKLRVLPRGATGYVGPVGPVGPSSYSPAEEWEEIHSYTVGPPASVVTYLGETYLCNTAHTSAATFTPDAAKWTKLLANTSAAEAAGYAATAHADQLTVAADKATVAADKATVAADKSTTSGYKDAAAASAIAAASSAAAAEAVVLVTISSGLTVAVAAFSLGAWSCAGGSLALVANGAWFVGVDLFTKQVIALQRLGHRGWVPVAKVVTGASTITSIEQIEPRMPASRLPRATKKLMSSTPLNVLVLGSSLAAGTATDTWAGMLFNSSSLTSQYKLPGANVLVNAALGGTPNHFQMAQLGFGTAMLGPIAANAAVPRALDVLAPAVRTWDFASDLDGWTVGGYGSGAVSGGKFVTTLDGGGSVYPALSVTVQAGDIIDLTFDYTVAGSISGGNVQIGLGGWHSNVVLKTIAEGSYTNQRAIITAADAGTWALVFYMVGGANGATFALDNIVMKTIRRRLPNGRSNLLDGVDVAIVTTLANQGDYSLQLIEPIVRRLRERGIEVILTTDNPQNPGADYAGMVASLLYRDGPEVIRIADLYGCELADTAAYVAEAQLRYGAGIYADTIHMATAVPAGRTAAPSGGHEVWARAVRSLLTVDSTTDTVTYDWVSGLQGATAIGGASLANVDGELVVTTTAWGGVQLPIPATNGNVAIGDTITVTGKIAGSATSVNFGITGGAANYQNVSNTFTATFTAAAAAQSLFVNNNASSGTVVLDNLMIQVEHAATTPIDRAPGREVEAQKLPACRVVADLKTPGDAQIILPRDEKHYLLADAYAGGMSGTNFMGAASFGRLFCTTVTAADDELWVQTGKRVAFAGFGVVGAGMVHAHFAGYPSIVADVYRDGTFVKTLTIAAPAVNSVLYTPILTSTEMAVSSPNPVETLIELRITAGYLPFHAGVLLTSDVNFLPPELARFVGTWTAKVLGGDPYMMGYGTDTPSDYAEIVCPPSAKRLSWLVSSKPNSQAVHTASGSAQALSTATEGTSAVKVVGGHLGSSELHTIQLAAYQEATDQAINGYGLHVGGILVVNDR